MKSTRVVRDSGAAAVEFALIAIILVTMLFLIIEGGRLFMMQAGASTAARDAARTMAISSNEGWARQDAKDVFEPYGVLENTDIVFAKSCPEDPGENDSVRVVVSYEASLITGFFPGPVSLTGTGEMRCGG